MKKHLTFPEYEALTTSERDAYRKQTLCETLQDGRETARKWKDNWHPGGPCVFHPHPRETGVLREFWMISVANYRAWHKAFDSTYKVLGKTCIRNFRLFTA